MKKEKLNVEGMHCNSCDMLIEDALDDIGVKANASHKKGEVEVEYDETKVKKEQITKAIESEGYKVKG